MKRLISVCGSDEAYRAIRRRSSDHIKMGKFLFPFGDGWSAAKCGEVDERNLVALLIKEAWDEETMAGKAQLEAVRAEYGREDWWPTAYGWATMGRVPAWDGKRPDKRATRKANDEKHAKGKNYNWGRLDADHMPADRAEQLLKLLGR